MQLYKYEVKPDWQEFDRLRNREYLQLWRSLQGLVFGSTAATILLSILPLPAQLEITLRTALTFVVFLTYSLWVIFHSENHSIRWLLPISLLFIVSSVVAGYSFPWPQDESLGVIWPHLVLPVSIVIPVIGWSILAWSYRHFPSQLRRIGFFPENWPFHVLIGFAAGGILGFHFLISNLLLTGNGGQFIIRMPQILWTFLFLIGIAAIGEEFLLRGVGFQLLYEEEQNNFWSVAGKLALLDLLIYIVPMFHTEWSTTWVWLLLYQVAFAFIVTFLRYKQGSLIACIMCNVIFHTLVASVGLW
jgi:membrane protease YdiL (CAAX protease family)